MGAYAEAVRRAVTPGCHVLDIGAGPGIFSILACRYGAGSVVAIEPGDIAELIPALAEANGCGDKISVFKGLSVDYSGPKADLIVSDLRGRLPLYEGHVEAIIDARERLLDADGKLIPCRDVLRIAVAHNPSSYKAIENPWLENAYQLDLTAGHRFAVNEWSVVHLEADTVLTETRDLAVLDYRSIADPNLVASASLPVARAGLAHGLLLWFDADLGEGLGYSNAPGCPRQIYGQTFLPFERSLELSPGQIVKAEIRADLVHGEYVWSWNTQLPERGVAFRQSTFAARILSPDGLSHRSRDYVPPIQPSLEVDRFCLGLLDGKTSLGMIAKKLVDRFPENFASDSKALEYAADISERYALPGKPR